MAKKTLKQPGLAVVWGAAGAAPVKSGAFVDMGAKFAGFNITESADKIDVTTSEDEGFRSYIEGLTDFSVELMFKGGDTSKDYALFRAQKGQTGLFVVYQKRGSALGAENSGWAFLGKYFDISLPGEIGSAQDFTVTIAPSGGGGVTFATADDDITGTTSPQLGYTAFDPTA